MEYERSGIVLQTPRLTVFLPERAEHLLLLDDIRALENWLGLLPGRDDFDHGFYEALGWLYNSAEAAPHRHWLAYWQIICKEGLYGVGGACFKGPPNRRGEVEVGYGILESFRCKGYITEALDALVRWAFLQPG